MKGKEGRKKEGRKKEEIIAPIVSKFGECITM
jgi:cytochrome c-type biogenesis protein CcmH/NrfF